MRSLRMTLAALRRAIVSVLRDPETRALAMSSTPSTNVVVASLPARKQGVASALNDVTREFGAALGIALLGSPLAGLRAQAVRMAQTALRRSPAGASYGRRRSRPGWAAAAPTAELRGGGPARGAA